MEPVSLSLSALSLFLECLKAYQLFSTAKCVTSDLRIVKTKFLIEETRFTQWGFHWGYSHDSQKCQIDERLDDAGGHVAVTVRATLAQIKGLLKEYEDAVARFDRKGSRVGGMVRALKDKSRLEGIVGNLNHFNDALHQLLPKRTEVSLARAVACSLTEDSNGGELDDVITAMASMQCIDAVKLARFKKAYQMLAMEDEKLQQPPPYPNSPIYLDESRFRFSTRYTSDSRTLSGLDNTRALVEWKAYHPALLSGSAASRLTIRHRVTHLAELMSDRSRRPAGFNVLTCRGYFDQPTQQRFGFAFEFPGDVLQHMPFTLQELLSTNNMPDLGTRFSIAVSFARTVNILHAAGWLHKSIRSNNILIFQDPETNIPLLTTPYLVGFNFSRPDGYGEETFHERSARESSNQLYRHSEVQGPNPRRYTAADDVFSVGLVLLEIALWRPLVDIEGRKEGDTAPLNIDKIMRTVKSSLPKGVGWIYTTAVERCLNMNVDSTLAQLSSITMDNISPAEWNAERLRRQNQFYWDVIRKLEECRA